MTVRLSRRQDGIAEAAEAAGKSETLARYAKDYPVGPHDQPQSMCPAFGSLRVGLRMRRTATVLSGSACCVYGLTFTSHFYGARRTVGYVPFNSETLVTGKLFEDIREAVFKLADPAHYDAVVVINLCVPTASGVPLQLLPKEINGVRIIGIDVPGFGVPTHAEAKDVLAGAMLSYARREAEQGPVQAPRAPQGDKPTVTLLGEMFPADPVGIGMLLEPLGLAAGPVVPTREWRELYGALDCAAVAAIHPFYTASIREFEAAGRTVVGSAPVGVRRHGGLARRDRRGVRCRARASSTLQRPRCCRRSAPRSRRRRSRDASRCRVMKAPNFWSARLLVESGADVRYVGTACPRTPWSDADREWLEAKGVRVQYRASLEQDLAAMRGVRARSRDRHDAGRAEGEGACDPGALFHQSDLGASAVRRRRRRLAGAGRQRGDREQGALRRHARVLRRRRRGRRGGHLANEPVPRPASARNSARPRLRRPSKRKSEEMV